MNFKEELESIRQLIGLAIAPNLKQPFLRMTYISAISCMETYLSDALASKIFDKTNPKVRLFVENHGAFSDIKIPVSAIYGYYAKMDQHVKRELTDLIYHNLDKIGKIYNKCLGVSFKEHGAICEAVRKRHDLVHHNGKTKDGRIISLEVEEVSQLLGEIDSFVDDLDLKINPVPF
jgi:hypothetical protein